MDFENKILSREVHQILYESGKTVGTAESCTGGKIAESLIAVPGASTYFKGSVISYTDEIKEKLLNVDHQLLEEKTAVCEEVAIAMSRAQLRLSTLTMPSHRPVSQVPEVERKTILSAPFGWHVARPTKSLLAN